MPNATPKTSPKQSARPLSVADRKAITAKFGFTPADLEAAMAKPAAPVRRSARSTPLRAGAARAAAWGEAPERKFYLDFNVGKFEGEPHLVWVKPDVFRLEPVAGQPFRFTRTLADGQAEVIEPGRMFTDGGSIPRAVGVFSSKLSPWGYAPAFLVHDWLFDCHHAGTTDKGFEEVRDIMMEGIKTLMESGVCEPSRLAFDLIYAGIDSPVARVIWNRKPKK